MPREDDFKKFRELAVKRVRKTIKHIRLVGNLANRSNYAYADEDAKKIISTLQKEINSLKARFEKQGNDDEIEFDL